MKAFVDCVVVGLQGNFLQIGGIRIWGNNTGWPAIPGADGPLNSAVVCASLGISFHGPTCPGRSGPEQALLQAWAFHVTSPTPWL